MVDSGEVLLALSGFVAPIPDEAEIELAIAMEERRG
jgi:hypothetical protein